MDFQILGSLRVTDHRHRQIALGGDKPAALLAMLLLRPHEVISADRLIEDLWEGHPPATAAKTLQVHISRLRRALADGRNGDRGNAITTTRGGYGLEVDPEQIDAQRFESLVTEGRGDAPDEHAECLLVLARALLAADREPEARDVAAAALRLSEAQEHLVFAQQARDLLGARQPAVAG
jgi:DNA-binding SARP family transcriptional activator